MVYAFNNNGQSVVYLVNSTDQAQAESCARVTLTSFAMTFATIEQVSLADLSKKLKAGFKYGGLMTNGGSVGPLEPAVKEFIISGKTPSNG